MLPAGTDPYLALQDALKGRYSLERELGRGGMGIVYLAHEVALDRPVALKLLPPALAAQPELRERFLREARTAAKLSHPYIVPIFAVDRMNEFVFSAMAYVEGETLGQRIRSLGPLPAPEAARVLRDVAWAVGYAHAQGVIHRDLKADNILLEQGSGRALVTDFGIAQVRSNPRTSDRRYVVGHRRVHEPRAGERRGGGRAERRLLAGRGGVLRRDRPAAVRRRYGLRGPGQAPHPAGAAARRCVERGRRRVGIWALGALASMAVQGRWGGALLAGGIMAALLATPLAFLVPRPSP